jgi:serine protease Do
VNQSVPFFVTQIMKHRQLRTLIVGLVGAVIGSFSMMLYAGAHYGATAAAADAPPPVAAAPVEGMSDQARIVAAVKRDEPSVVALDVEVNGKRFVPANPFMQLFGGAPNVGQMLPYRAQASGSGFVYSKDGLIVTNAHVVQFGQGTDVKITAIFQNGDKVPAHVYAANPAADIALVKVDHYAKLPPPLDFSRSGSVQAGQWAIAIGEPFALQDSVSVGVVSGFNRTETIGDDNGAFPRTFKGLLQTSAPINPGNSGGPLIDYDGRVIGVNQSVASPQAGAQGIGFAIPIDTVKQQVALLEQHPGQMKGPAVAYLGISMTPVDDNVRSQLNYHGNGVAIEGVYQGGPADKAGLQPGDVIEKIDGKDVTSAQQVQDAVHAAKPGQEMHLQIWSSGFKKMATVKIEEAPEDFPTS